jgi:hypothetical protein
LIAAAIKAGSLVRNIRHNDQTRPDRSAVMSNSHPERPRRDSLRTPPATPLRSEPRSANRPHRTLSIHSRIFFSPMRVLFVEPTPSSPLDSVSFAYVGPLFLPSSGRPPAFLLPSSGRRARTGRKPGAVGRRCKAVRKSFLPAWMGDHQMRRLLAPTTKAGTVKELLFGFCWLPRRAWPLSPRGLLPETNPDPAGGFGPSRFSERCFPRLI